MLHVDRVDTLLTEKVHITASGLHKFHCYKFYLRCHYNEGDLNSCCVIQSDKFGTIDLARDKPIRGTYNEVDPMGLFISMQLSEEVPFGHYIRNFHAVPFYYTLSLLNESGETVDKVNLMKRWIHPCVTEIEVEKDGLYGLIYKPPGPGPFPCIVDMPGINGQMPKSQPAVFSQYGFFVYTFAIFDYKELKEKKQQDVDLAVISKHLDIVKSFPYCSGSIGVHGISLGGTIANYVASKHGELKGVVTVNCPEAFYEPTSQMKENGVLMNCVKLDGSLEVYHNGIKVQKPCFVDCFNRLQPENMIKWENISKDIPFRIVASFDDLLLDGVKNAKNIKRHLENTGHSVEIEFGPGGHALNVPYFPHQPILYNKFLHVYLGLGGDYVFGGKTQEKMWENNLKFFRKHLGTPPSLPDYERQRIVMIPGKLESKL